ncbi:hypothetical protein [Pseudomonas sp. Irchel s3f7]|uniref:hypothetical protein n=1 Tax=Pseudomonas sp. Irchel s3f7 TaxID=2009153 RepID=UPI00117AFCAB|nr:hypothetical protein [Pseudomonas sp. Irchel s3f7]
MKTFLRAATARNESEIFASIQFLQPVSANNLTDFTYQRALQSGARVFTQPGPFSAVYDRQILADCRLSREQLAHFMHQLARGNFVLTAENTFPRGIDLLL